MRSLTLVTILVVAVASGCSTAKDLKIAHCQSILVVQPDPDCKDGSVPWRRTQQTHCVVSDPTSGCRVGAIQFDNPRYSLSNSAALNEPKYFYARLYDWECPVGAVPSARAAHFFFKTLRAPMACDDQGNPLPSNPLLHPKPTSLPSSINAGDPPVSPSDVQ